MNAYLGLEGYYILTDDEEQALNLPASQYDVPLALSAKQYSSNGTLVYDTHDNQGVPGDVIQVSVCRPTL
jgi:bilirubin oxidase